MKKLFAALVNIVTLLVLPTQHASATTIVREVLLTPSLDQVVQGGFGSGYFWHPNFDLTPIVNVQIGDTVELVVRFQPGYRLIVNAGSVEQESIGAGIYLKSGQSSRSTHLDSWRFIDPLGDLLVADQSGVIGGSEGGLGMNFNPLDLTDTTFSIAGIRVRFDLIPNQGTFGFPADFDAGHMSIQTQGSFAIQVSEPSTPALYALAIVLAGLGCFRGPKTRRPKSGRTCQRCVWGQRKAHLTVPLDPQRAVVRLGQQDRPVGQQDHGGGIVRCHALIVPRGQAGVD